MSRQEISFAPPPDKERKAFKFYRLNQKGISRIPDVPNLGLSGFPYDLYKNETRTHRSQSRSAMREACRMLGITSPREIPGIIDEPTEDREIRKKKSICTHWKYVWYRSDRKRS